MDGIIVVNKPAGMTSHDVVFRLRKILKTKKIGHTGTLDPNATGVLLVLVGKATKILPFIEDVDKEYIATMKLGIQTLSDDIWDEVLDKKAIIPIEDFKTVLSSFKGKIKQTPPRISSIKVNGKKLYEYTRNGEDVELPIREVEIYDIESLDDEQLKFRTHCSSGTYIRSLCVDIAKKTNNLGCMSSLVRTKVGRFHLKEAQELETLSLDNVNVHSIDEMLDHFEKIEYSPITDVLHGKKIHLDTQSNRVCITHEQKCYAIYERVNDMVFKSVRGLW
ncbi:tRNA pseudouridine55 synthase [Breznakia sp. PF5-3]|uniref:tRNA pseudouridine(55) synthase TruB n=1 Tax=unclassified Breznakia TaxID=2623764 RepID=UPI002406F872|nr:MULTISPECIES: tRNA pseudouridine(55) synthase TruB [unclassified Breznakia]MDL2276465.1 tRNA pseudouridine(55) synthase TruB [Breznakia sp. OttesenSCG-928-G09]MDF9823904.1 tRNA pseudouridine55 synthase [Breznakia sp. PM6-1]MDF9834703.1 tRNA pseudouridine55 synthase [Breznakia sp. PF5-3]MDF9836862.1 tRNA pseudouridine55 synthase [Breznakia sp. PFB2-8]MDF9858879.1 tRNA pseudouridine55 synthase [Breznakia sp. PH5-24]